MDFVKVHSDWWDRRHKGEDPFLAALGLFKAYRNFVDPVLKSKQRMYDYRPEALEALGDAVMYLSSFHKSHGRLLQDPGSVEAYIDIDIVCKDLCWSFGRVIQGSSDVLSSYYAIRAVSQAAGMLGSDFVTVASKATEKLL